MLVRVVTYPGRPGLTALARLGTILLYAGFIGLTCGMYIVYDAGKLATAWWVALPFAAMIVGGIVLARHASNVWLRDRTNIVISADKVRIVNLDGDGPR